MLLNLWEGDLKVLSFEAAIVVDVELAIVSASYGIFQTVVMINILLTLFIAAHCSEEIILEGVSNHSSCSAIVWFDGYLAVLEASDFNSTNIKATSFPHLVDGNRLLFVRALFIFKIKSQTNSVSETEAKVMGCP